MLKFAMKSLHKPLIVVMGATGTGKTKLAVQLCQRFNGEVISTDSMQIYKCLPISTNQATAEEKEGIVEHMVAYLPPSVTTHTVLHFRERALKIMDDIWSREKLPIVVGGTSYYMEALLWHTLIGPANGAESEERFDEEPSTSLVDWYGQDLPSHFLQMSNVDLHAELRSVDEIEATVIHPNNRKRVLSALQTFYRSGKAQSALIAEQHSSDLHRSIADSTKARVGGKLRFRNTCMIWLTCGDNQVLDERLANRVSSMVTAGLRCELTTFYDGNYAEFAADLRRVMEEHNVSMENMQGEMSKGVFQSIGLKEFASFLQLSPEERSSTKGEKEFAAGCERLKIATRQYSRRQHRWVNNRLLRQTHREVPPIYKLDTSDASQWNATVWSPAERIVDHHLSNYANEDGDTVSDEMMDRHLVERRPLAEQHKHVTKLHDCEACAMQLQSLHQYEAHCASKAHRANVAKRKRVLADS